MQSNIPESCPFSLKVNYKNETYNNLSNDFKKVVEVLLEPLLSVSRRIFESSLKRSEHKLCCSWYRQTTHQ